MRLVAKAERAKERAMKMDFMVVVMIKLRRKGSETRNQFSFVMYRRKKVMNVKLKVAAMMRNKCQKYHDSPSRQADTI